MLRIIMLISAFFIFSCVPVDSEQILLDKPVNLFDKNSVYKFEVPLTGTKIIKDDEYRHTFKDQPATGYIEYANNNRYLATVDAGENVTEQYDIVIEKFNRSFSLLSNYYIFVVNHIKKDNIKEIQNAGSGFYFFVEQSRSGDWYSYIPLWPISRTIKLSNRQELLELAEKIFSQSRDKAAHKAVFLQRERSDIDYIQLRKKHAQQVEHKRQEEQKALNSKQQSQSKKLQADKTRYLVCEFSTSPYQKRLLVTLDRKQKTIHWSPPDQPQNSVGCTLEETDTYSSGICLDKFVPVNLDSMLVKPAHNYEKLISDPDSYLCAKASSNPKPNGAFDLGPMHYKEARKINQCTARSWAKRHEIKPDSANIVAYRQLRINRYSLAARLHSAKTVQVYSKSKNTYHWTNTHRWKEGDNNGKCKFTEKPRRQF